MSTRARAMKLGKLPQTSFDHMLRRSRPQGNRPNRFEHTPKYVQPKDRIALWNICPNDRVRVITGRFKGKVGTVQYVNREYNRVYLREAEFKVRLAVWLFYIPRI